ncbi:MAG TPA: lipopolysaccharide assembly protein LapA domain-containing protein [Acidimicrobiales bacterium]
MTDPDLSASSEPVPTAAEVPVVAEQSPPKGRRARRRARSASPAAGERHTRISGAWAAVAAATVLGVALVDFIVENTRAVEIHFFSVSGRLSVAAALLAAALAGAAVVLAVGVSRTAQLRLSIRHRRRAQRRQVSAQDEAGAPSDQASN